MMEELKSKMENSNSSNSNFQNELLESKNSCRLLEDEKQHLQSKLLSKEKEIEDLSDDIRKLKRQFEVVAEDKDSEFHRIRSTLQRELEEVTRIRDNLSMDLEKTKSSLNSATLEASNLQVTHILFAY